MSVYVPWPERPPKTFKGLSKPIAAVAVSLYQLFKPIVQRFAGVIFLVAVVGGSLGAWIVALLVQSQWAAEAALLEGGIIQAGQYANLEQWQQGKLANDQAAAALWQVLDVAHSRP